MTATGAFSGTTGGGGMEYVYTKLIFRVLGWRRFFYLDSDP